jgi:hypothetical protein
MEMLSSVEGLPKPLSVQGTYEMHLTSFFMDSVSVAKENRK